MVLDVCCGSGTSALPAARAAAPNGRVIGLDLAPPMLVLARERAVAESLANVEFRHADFDQAYFRAASFDAVLCNFGIFFFTTAASLQKMWRFVRPGGVLALTVWAEGAWAPTVRVFPRERRWTPLTRPGALAALFAEARIPGVEIAREDYTQAIESPEDWWTLALGTGCRKDITPENEAELRAACLAIPERTVPLPVYYGIARR
jgi:SAM-dependent methyltransferase